MLCAFGAKATLDTCCPAKGKSNLPIDERGQPFRHWIKQWVRSIERVSSIHLESHGPCSVTPQNRVTVLRKDMAAGVHLVACRRTSEDQLPRYTSEAGPCIAPLFSVNGFPVVCSDVSTKHDSVAMRFRKKRTQRARDLGPNL